MVAALAFLSLNVSAAPAGADAYLESLKKDLGDGYALFWDIVDSVFAAQKLSYDYYQGELRPSGPVPEAVYPTISVGPIAKACAGAPKSRWPAVVKDLLAPALAAPPTVAEPSGLTFEDAKARVYPELVAERLLPPESKLCFLAKSGLSGIYFMLALAMPSGKQYLRKADAARWGKSFDELFALARDNLVSGLAAKTSGIKLRGRDVMVVRSGTPYTASLSYFAASEPGWLGDKGMLFIIPSKDWLVLAPIGKKNSYDLVYDLYALARSLSSPSTDSLVASVYWTDGKKAKELTVTFWDDRTVVGLPEELKACFSD